MRYFVRLLLTGSAVAGAIVCIVAAVIFAGPWGASAQARPERIVSYDAGAVIQRDGSILVTEQIVYDFGSDARHGISREIPVVSRYNGGYDRIYPLSVRSVQSLDAPDQYQVEDRGSSAIVRIGDPGRTVTGVHTYRLTYLMRGSLNAFTGHDELYWNAVGARWNVPIGRVTVKVTAPAAVTRAVCHAGPPGSTRSCATGGVADGAASFTQTGLAAHEGVTVAVAIPEGVVAVPRPILRERWSLQRAFDATPVSLGVSGGLLLVLVLAGAVMFARRPDRRPATPAAALPGESLAQFRAGMPANGHGEPLMECSPPEGLRPGQAGTLLDGVASPDAIMGTIVDLAVRGYLQIRDEQLAASTSSRDLRLARLGKTGGLLDYEQVLLDGLFKDATKDVSGQPAVQLSVLTLGRPLRQARSALYADAVSRGWFTARPDRIRLRWRAVGSIVLIVSVIALVITAASSHYGLVPVPFVLAGGVMMAMAGVMPVRTEKGRDLLRQLLGFREYIKAATLGQASLPGRYDVLYEYLPYAIVFRCTRDWAELTAELAGPGEMPPWYWTSAPFRAANLATLSRSSYYFVPYYIATRTVWNGSGTSASGGSGFSGGYTGGGVGGGGGGSW
jgi:uncharacterized membrane protein YgcG